MIRFDVDAIPPVRVAAFLLTLTATGCGNFTAGGVTGEARVHLSGDAPDPAPTSVVAQPPTAFASSPLPTDHDDDQPHEQNETNVSMRSSVCVCGLPDRL